MSRSRKKTPASTIACCKSQKKDKQMCNRLFRSKSKQYIRVGKEPPCRLREVMNVWNFSHKVTDYRLGTAPNLPNLYAFWRELILFNPLKSVRG